MFYEFHVGSLVPSGSHGPPLAPHRTLWSMGSHFSQMSPSGETSASHRVHTLPHIHNPPQNMSHLSLHTITSTQASLLNAQIYIWTYARLSPYLSASSYSFPFKKKTFLHMRSSADPDNGTPYKKTQMFFSALLIQCKTVWELKSDSWYDFYKLGFSEFKTYNVTLS